MAQDSSKLFEDMAKSKGLTAETIRILGQHDFDSTEAMKHMDLKNHLPALKLEACQEKHVKAWIDELNGRSGVTYSSKECTNNLNTRDDMIRDAGKRIATHGLKEFEDLVRQNLSKLKSMPVNVCVIGEQSTGKSSLIAGLLETQIPPNLSAQSGDMIPYQSTQIPDIIFWDCNARISKNQAIISKFDAMIICSCRRFSEMDLNLAKVAHINHMPLYYVRTMLDQDVSNDQRDRGPKFNESSLIESIKQDAKNNLAIAGINNAKILTLSTVAKYKQSWDFPELCMLLKENPPKKNLRKFLEQMHDVAVEFVDTKHAELARNDTMITNTSRVMKSGAHKEHALQEILKKYSHDYDMGYHNSPEPYDDTTSDDGLVDSSSDQFVLVKQSQLTRCVAGDCTFGEIICFLFLIVLTCSLWLLVDYYLTKNRMRDADRHNEMVCMSRLKQHNDACRRNAQKSIDAVIKKHRTPVEVNKLKRSC